MSVFKENKRRAYVLAVILGAALSLMGCAATIHYSYDPLVDFSMYKNYRWESGMLANRLDPLIEKNVRFHADQSLNKKGFTLNPDHPDFVISMNYELEYSDPYQVRFLRLYVYKSQNKDIIWQGTAGGNINADAAYRDLAGNVEKILMNFPPKKGKR